MNNTKADRRSRVRWMENELKKEPRSGCERVHVDRRAVYFGFRRLLGRLLGSDSTTCLLKRVFIGPLGRRAALSGWVNGKGVRTSGVCLPAGKENRRKKTERKQASLIS